MQKFDVIVIGGGPGGYVAAIKLAALGKKVACVESRKNLGGTCLNVGCIPSKSLLDSTWKFYEAKHHFPECGVIFDNITFSVDKMMEKKNKVVQTLTSGIAGLFKKNKVTHIYGKASFITSKRLKIEEIDSKISELEAENIIIATGSEPTMINGINIDEQQILTSTGSLELKTPPKKMIVIGAGIIGLEMASVWSRLGSEVQIVEYSDKLLPSFDTDVSSFVSSAISKQGMNLHLGMQVENVSKNGNQCITSVLNRMDNSKIQFESDVVLVAIGRRPYTKGLGLIEVGIEIGDRGDIKVNKNFQTNIPGVYAIGDVIRGPMLAHKASEEAIAVAEIICNQHGHVNYETIPGVIYTHPEVAVVGKTEQELIASNTGYKKYKFPFLANSRAKTTSNTDGFVKIIACDKTDTILGAHIVGHLAGDLISELIVGMEFKASSEDIARISHSHPGFAEAIKEAAMGVYSKPIHF